MCVKIVERVGKKQKNNPQFKNFVKDVKIMKKI
jgi:hypothetical protein